MLENIKIKPLTKEQLIISIDRLTRFKNTETKYIRVFTEIISNNLICPKIKKTELEKLNYNSIKNLAEQIINYSLEKLNLNLEQDFTINQKIFDYENSIFELSENTNILLQNKINYKAFINLLGDNIPQNLVWLKNLDKKENINNSYYFSRREKSSRKIFLQIRTKSKTTNICTS